MENSTPAPIKDDRRPREAFELLLSESIQRLHSDRRSGVSNFVGFSSIFSRLIQTTADPPLEALWFYLALTFRSENMELVKRVSLVKELFGFMVSYSGRVSGLKKVAALAPVVYELHRLVGDVMFWFSEARDDVKCLIEGVVSYVSMCCYENREDFGGMLKFSPLLMDVVNLWLADKGEVGVGHAGDSRLFFPMVSDEVRARIVIGRELGFLAGSVMCEVFLLSLSLECCSEVPRLELQKHLHQQAVQVIAGFRDLNFFDTLLRMLSEPTLPVTHLVGYAGESLLREVLCDVATTAQYSIVLPVNGYQLSEHSTEVALRWLLITEKATHVSRASGYNTKALYYENAFSESSIPGQLIDWVTFKTGSKKPVLSSSAALIRWFLAFEDTGLKIVNDPVLKAHMKAVALNPAFGSFTDADTNNNETVVGNHNLDQEMADSAYDWCTSPLDDATAMDGQRKRKEDRQHNAYLRAKFIKVHCHGKLATT
uniref:Uncharacterized protein n=1 Tax=Kalanchoe fedtschenkoi TaxID=63787 RepID=A0A7N0RDC3_KALFE